MTLEEFYFVSQILSVGLIIGSLIFVGVQLRQNTLAMRATAHHAITDTINQANLAVTQSPDLARVWNAGLKDRGSLTEEEMLRFDFQCLAYFHVFDTLHYQARTGAGDEALLRAEEPGIAGLFENPGINAWWDENPYGLGPEFRKYVEELRAQTHAGVEQS
jgi:hypothetical protein